MEESCVWGFSLGSLVPSFEEGSTWAFWTTSTHLPVSVWDGVVRMAKPLSEAGGRDLLSSAPEEVVLVPDGKAVLYFDAITFDLAKTVCIPAWNLWVRWITETVLMSNLTGTTESQARKCKLSWPSHLYLWYFRLPGVNQSAHPGTPIIFVMQQEDRRRPPATPTTRTCLWWGERAALSYYTRVFPPNCEAGSSTWALKDSFELDLTR